MRFPLLAVGVSSALAPAFGGPLPPRRFVAPRDCPWPAVVVPTCPPLGPTSPTGPTTPPGTLPLVTTPPVPTPGGGTPTPTPTPDPTTPTPTPNPTPTPTPTPPAGGGFSRPGEGGTQAAASAAPNMFGDLLGVRSLKVSYQATAFARYRLVGADFLADGTRAVVVSPTASGRGNITFTSANRTNTVDLTALANGRNLDYVQPVTLPGSIDPAFASQSMELLLSRGVLTAAQREQLARLTPDQRAQLLRNRGLLNPALAQTLGGLATSNVRVTGLTADFSAGDVLYAFGVRSEGTLPLPSGGSPVGRVKMSEDNSPLPRDRFIFAHDSFDNVPFTAIGLTVNRFQFGVEKTFRDGLWSAEFRLPFAGTLASTNFQGAEVAHTELGNVRLALKRLVSQSDVLTTSAGVGLTLPTADDQVLYSGYDGSLLYRFRNRAVTVEPFAAALFTPNDRVFAQVWGSVNFDTTGGDLTYNPAVFGGTGSARVRDVPLLAVDVQLGYWLVRQGCGTLRGLAPFVELHYNRALDTDFLARQVNANSANTGLSVQGVGSTELNLVAGFSSQIGDNLLLSVAGGAPLLRRPDRTFDAQVGVRASYLFGRTARARNPIAMIGTY